MVKFIQKSLIVAALVSTAFSALADKGVGKKNKNKVTLNVATVSTLRSSISYNLRTGLTYTGSLNTTNLIPRGILLNNTAVTFQKGNTTYIIPYKQRIIIPDVKQGYVGMKLIIKPH